MKKQRPFYLLILLTLLSNTALAVEQTYPGMMEKYGMMNGGYMFICMAFLVLVFIALILAILSLIKFLFFNKSKRRDL
ncbi:hypothetical protein [uncultured Methylophaga sp.]|jgi:uncharacterized membrane protein|uniref:hypothetical protein n=1 Tax=uncultured Methylophaga sp. TaxID=285271 RepID=UPI0030DB7BF2|tara:strand:- start:902 stop:1135 length:234 start_codon:yes stop_codon:yes gene_type:complete